MISLTVNQSALSSDLGDPCGIRTRDLYLERVASWAARRTGQGAAAPAFAASGVYAIDFADHEAHAAGGVRHAADLVVDEPGGRADQDQVTLVDVTGLTALWRQQPDAACLIDALAPVVKDALDISRGVGANKHYVDWFVVSSCVAASPLERTRAQTCIHRYGRRVER